MLCTQVCHYRFAEEAPTFNREFSKDLFSHAYVIFFFLSGNAACSITNLKNWVGIFEVMSPNMKVKVWSKRIFSKCACGSGSGGEGNICYLYLSSLGSHTAAELASPLLLVENCAKIYHTIWFGNFLRRFNPDTHLHYCLTGCLDYMHHRYLWMSLIGIPDVRLHWWPPGSMHAPD